MTHVPHKYQAAARCFGNLRWRAQVAVCKGWSILGVRIISGLHACMRHQRASVQDASMWVCRSPNPASPTVLEAPGAATLAWLKLCTSGAVPVTGHQKKTKKKKNVLTAPSHPDSSLKLYQCYTHHTGRCASLCAACAVGATCNGLGTV